MFSSAASPVQRHHGILDYESVHHLSLSRPDICFRVDNSHHFLWRTSTGTRSITSVPALNLPWLPRTPFLQPSSAVSSKLLEGQSKACPQRVPRPHPWPEHTPNSKSWSESQVKLNDAENFRCWSTWWTLTGQEISVSWPSWRIRYAVAAAVDWLELKLLPIFSSRQMQKSCLCCCQ